MELELERARAPLERFLAKALGAGACSIGEMTRLAGGTVQDNWLVVLHAGASGAPPRRLVLRTGRVVGVKDSLPAEHEYAVLCAAAGRGASAFLNRSRFAAIPKSSASRFS